MLGVVKDFVSNQGRVIALLLALLLPLTQALISPNPVRADWDYQASFAARTVPFGGTFAGTLGHGFLLWGEDPTPSLPLNGPPVDGVPKWKFGYLRPSLTLQTIGFTTRSLLELDFFPISIIGFTLGQAVHYRLDRASQFDCTQVNCNGFLNRTYIRGQAIAGLEKIALMAWAQYANVSSPGALPFLEETSALLGTATSDQLGTLTLTAMYKVQDDLILGVLGSQSKFFNSGNNGFMSLGYANYFKDHWGFFLGAGTYSSSHQNLSPTVYGWIQFMGKRPMGWF